jgi:CxxC motif-containing protein
MNQKVRLVCIECPMGCGIEIDMDDERRIREISGHGCPRGESYARAEIEDPVRYVTSTVPARGLTVKMVPVRTDAPIPRDRVLDAMAEIRKLKVERSCRCGETLVEDFLGMGVNLIVTRTCAADGFEEER